MFVLEVILAILAYFVISRVIITLGLVFVKVPAFFEDNKQEDFYFPDSERPFMLIPVIGEIVLLISIFVCLIYHPMMFLDCNAQKVRDYFVNKGRKKQEWINLLTSNNLSKKELPKYIKTADDLQSYLKARQQVDRMA